MADIEPGAERDAELEADVAAMRQAMAEHAEGRSRPAVEVFDDIRRMLVLMAERAGESRGS